MFLFLAAAAAGISWSVGPPCVPYELTVGFTSRTAFESAVSVVRLSGKTCEEIPGIQAMTVRFPEGTSRPAAESWLSRLPNALYIEPNYFAKAQFIPNDPAFPNQFNLRLVAAAPAWDVEQGASNVVIAILDSGIDTDHPELVSKIKPGHDFVQEDNSPEDDFGHGTFCAGIAAAETNNGIGLAGAAPGCTLMPVKVLDSTGYGTYSDIAQGIIYAADHGAKVISMSFAGSSYSGALENAVDYAWNKGSMLIAAAGNSGNRSPVFPAAIRRVLAVGSVNKIGRRSNFSNYGSWVSVAAPGEFVYSTYLNGGYASLQGTSMSTALVAGEAAIVSSRLGPSATPGLIRRTIERTSIPAGHVWRYGVVNFYRALLAARL